MSGPELPYKISSSEEIIAFLRKITKRVDDLLLHLNKMRLHDNKLHQQNQTMLQNFKLQMQTKAVPVSDLSILTKPTSRKIVASSDLATDPSAGLDSGGVIAQVFRGPSVRIHRIWTYNRPPKPTGCQLFE